MLIRVVTISDSYQIVTDFNSTSVPMSESTLVTWTQKHGNIESRWKPTKVTFLIDKEYMLTVFGVSGSGSGLRSFICF